MDATLLALSKLRPDELYTGGELCVKYVLQHPGSTLADVEKKLRQINSCLYIMAEQVPELPHGLRCVMINDREKDAPFRAFFSTRPMPYPLLEMDELGIASPEENLDRLKVTGMMVCTEKKDMAAIKHGELKFRTKEIYDEVAKAREKMEDDPDLARLILKEEPQRATVEEEQEAPQPRKK